MKRRIFSILFALVLVLSFGLVTAVPVVAQAATLQVDAATGTIHTGDPCPDPRDSATYADIQAAINCALAGDTVNVAAGTYNENITLKSGVIVQGAGAADTTIDGGGVGSVVTAYNVDSAAKLDGFTITNGSTTKGGGMRNDNSSPAVSNCTFWGNSVTDDGGGMYNYYSSPTVTSCTFSGNSATSPWSQGGGMYNRYSSPTVSNCTFSDNSAAEEGGGMHNYYSSPTVTNCTFSGNSATGEGGGMLNASSSPTVTNCTFSGNSGCYGGGMHTRFGSSPMVTNCIFSGNSATGKGGGMSTLGYSSPTVTNCTFSGNSATSPWSQGGGMHNDHSFPTVTNCTFWGNSATDGGGMYNYYSQIMWSGLPQPTITNCIFGGNSAIHYGGGMYNYSSLPTVTNCTFWGNSAPEGGGGMYSSYYRPGPYFPTVTNCILWGNGDDLYGCSATYSDIEDGDSGIGNISQDPMFVNAGVGDYHLQSGSPCIDKGYNTAPGLPEIDFDGNPRILDGDGDGIATVDMGAFELSNMPPVADANGPYNVPEGGSLPLSGSGFDPDGDPLTYSWDLDDDGTFETAAQNPTFSAVGMDGPSSQTVVLQVCDDKGACDTSSATVNITNVVPAVGPITVLPAAVVQVNTTITAGAGFTDPGSSDTHTAVWDWGDDTPTTTVDPATSPVDANHTYTAAGVYTVTLTVTDDDTGSGTSTFEYVVVYDTAGGFVTGGGWIDSPEGAYAPDELLTGKANFGFVSKYKKGADAPTGNTEFRFRAGDLNFHSTSYDWLVVAGATAKFKGLGTINGTGEYKFLLTAIDADINDSDNFDIDRFRIKIWQENDGEEVVVYDNALGDDSDAATTEIGGGSIVIHKK